MIAYKLRAITKAELHPTPLSGAVCHPFSGKYCTNYPKYILEWEGHKQPLCGVHAQVARKQIESVQRAMNPITDRAKRYRANRNPPPGRKICTFCARRENVDIDHVNGDEGDDSPENKMFLCRPCNTQKGIVQARNRIGVRTRQFNPWKVPTFAEFKHSAAVLLGVAPGDVGEATERVRATPPEKRAAFAEKLAANPEPPTYAQYAHAVSIHDKKHHAHDEGGAIIHATPPALRSKYARQIASKKKKRGTL